MVDLAVEERWVYPLPDEASSTKWEKFYLECTLKNPKDVWNEFTVVDNTSFEFSKTNTLLNQKSKNFLSVEKKKGDAMQCFGLIFTEDSSFKNWLNHKPEDLDFILPKKFQELEDLLMPVI